MIRVEVADGEVTRGAPATFQLTLKQDGAVLDLTGKTVTATVRAVSANLTVIDDSLEGISGTVVDAASGRADVELTAEQAALLDAPDDVTQPQHYYLTAVVDGWPLRPVKFPVFSTAASL